MASCSLPSRNFKCEIPQVSILSFLSLDLLEVDHRLKCFQPAGALPTSIYFSSNPDDAVKCFIQYLASMNEKKMAKDQSKEEPADDNVLGERIREYGSSYNHLFFFFFSFGLKISVHHMLAKFTA